MLTSITSRRRIQRGTRRATATPPAASDCAQTARAPQHLQACGLPGNHATIGGDGFLAVRVIEVLTRID